MKIHGKSKETKSLSSLFPHITSISLLMKRFMMTSSHQSHTTTSFKPRKIKTAKPPPNPPEKPPVLKCPRCDSLNTKFCYYNNYSLSQPRHYCKNCRRYWTRGGSLRNVPIGGSTRNKNKPPCTTTTTAFHVISSPTTNVTSSFSGGFSGYMFPLDPNYYNLLGSSSSSIETLSFLNQDLHQKLQEQRLITTTTSRFLQDSLPVNDKPVMFQNVELIPPSTVTTTEWGGGGGGAISGSIENNGEVEGNLGIWYHNANNALY